VICRLSGLCIFFEIICIRSNILSFVRIRVSWSVFILDFQCFFLVFFEVSILIINMRLSLLFRPQKREQRPIYTVRRPVRQHVHLVSLSIYFSSSAFHFSQQYCIHIFLIGRNILLFTRLLYCSYV